MIRGGIRKRAPKGPRQAKKAKTAISRWPGGITTAYKRPYPFSRRFYLTTYTFSTGAVTGFYNLMTFAFNQIPNSTDYGDLFREYKIKSIQIDMHPRYDNADGTAAAATSSVPTLHYRPETSSALAPAGVYNAATLNAYLDTGAKSVQFTKPVSVKFQPTIHTDVNNNVVETSGPRWIQTNGTGPAQVHSGLSHFITFAGFSIPTQTFSFDVYATFDFELRSPV